MARSGAAGIKIYIGTQATDASTDTYKEIEECTSGPVFGDSREVIKQKVLTLSRVLKAKGTADAGSFNLTFLYDSDATTADGQAALKLASEANNSTDYNFKFELADTPSSGAAPTPTTVLVKGLAVGFNIDAGSSGPDNFVTASSQIEINTIVSITAAATGG